MGGNTIRKAEASSSGTVVALPAKTIRSGHEELRSTISRGRIRWMPREKPSTASHMPPWLI